MRTFVLDASVALELYSPKADPEQLQYASAVLRLLVAARVVALVPRHWHIEVAHRLLTWRRSHSLSRGRFEEAHLFLADLPIDTARDQELELSTVLERAKGYHVQAFDLPYLDLAIELEVPLATLDGGLASAARREGVEVFQP